MTESTSKIVTIFKILIVGDSEVGKTSFILRFCDNTFPDESLTTIGIDTKTKFIKRNDKKIQLVIWDTAGQERFKSIAKNTLKGADGVFLMYAINKKNTFKSIKDWISSIKESLNTEKLGLLIIGNKCDLPEEEREVDDDMVKALQDKEKVEIIEASGKDNINVNESFLKLIDKMIELELGRQKTINDEYEDENENDKGQKLQLQNTIKRNNNNNCCKK